MDKIVVAVDLSDIASVAIEHAATFAGALKSHVHILHIVVPVPTYIGNEVVQPVIPTDNEEELERIRTDLSAMADYLRQRGIEADFELCKGPVVETIVEKAASLDADLIILGAHNHGFLYRAFIGSVCKGVIKHSPCPVLIIPAKEQ
jgi:nucleotide-binding universal stress UspA family protein